MKFKEKKYTYSTDILKIENKIETVIGMLSKEDGTWSAYLNGYGRITNNGFAFTTKKEAKEAIIKRFTDSLI